MNGLAEALRAWRESLGTAHVITDAAELAAAETATFATTQRIPAIIRPGTREEVQDCVRIANACQTPIYPISAGKNYGFGSRVPVESGCVLMELGRLNRIADYNERLAYVAVEPGVTFRQVHAFLREQRSPLMMSVTGSTPESSVLGNALERGTGTGMYGDRSAHICNLEVVLPTGERVQTGFGRFAQAQTAHLHRCGVGPALDGLFTQSNLGIVTRMTVWLMPIPRYLQVCFFAINDAARLPRLVDVLQSLMLEAVLRTPATLWNDYAGMARIQQYPWRALEDTTPMPETLLQRIRATWQHSTWWSNLWSGWTALPAHSSEVGRAERRIVAEALGDAADRLIFLDESGADVLRWDGPEDPAQIAKSIPGRWTDPDSSPFLGAPSSHGLNLPYWRKKTAVPATVDLDRDHCGYLYCAPAMPFEGQHVQRALEMVAEIIRAFSFEPVLTATTLSARAIRILATIIYDRDVAGEDERAMACHEALMDTLVTEGYIPHRLGILSTGPLSGSMDSYDALLHTLKDALDPRTILAPGRYGLGHRAHPDGFPGHSTP